MNLVQKFGEVVIPPILASIFMFGVTWFFTIEMSQRIIPSEEQLVKKRNYIDLHNCELRNNYSYNNYKTEAT